MIVKAPEKPAKRPTQPRPKIDLECAEIILGDAGKYGATGLMATWAARQKERNGNKQVES